MAEQNVPIRRYGPLNGLDLTSNDLRRPPGFMTGGKNFDINDRGDLVKRPGYKRMGELISPGAKGLAMWHGVGLSQAERSEVIILQDAPQKIVIGIITIDYTGLSGDDFRYQMFYDTGTSQFRAQIDNVTTSTNLMDLALGTGTGGDATLATLISTISGLTDFTATADANVTTTDFAATGTEAVVIDFDASPDAKIRTFHDEVLATPGSFSMTAPTSPDPPIYSTALVNDVLYVSGGAGPVGKYDGVNFYEAGLPKPSSTTLVTSSSASETYRYRYQYTHIDNAGNVVEGQLSDPEEIDDADMAGGGTVDITIDNLTADFSIGSFEYPDTEPFIGYDEGDTITLMGISSTELATLQIGEKVGWSHHPWTTVIADHQTLDDSITVNAAQTQFGTITGKPSATSVEIEVDQDGAIFPGMAVSQQLFVRIWRTKEEALDPTLSVYYLIGEFPLEAFAGATTVYTDAWGVGSSDRFNRLEVLGDVPPDFGAQPPQGRFLAEYRNHLVVAGVEDEPDIIHFSEQGRPDVFATAVNQFRVGTGRIGDNVSGLGSTEDYLMAFKDRSIYRITGDLGGAFQVDRVSSTVGCESHFSIQEISVGLLGFLSHRGPFLIARGQQIQPMGPTADGQSRLEVFFKSQAFGVQYQNGDSTNHPLNHAVAANWASEGKYILGLTVSGSPSTTSRTFVYDYERDFWSEWDIGMERGVLAVNTPQLTDTNGTLRDSAGWFLFLNAVGSRMNVMMPYGRRDEDYNDHGASYTFNPEMSWDTAGAPSHLKKFLRASVFSLDDLTFDLQIKQRINWDDTTNVSDITYDFNSGEDPSVKGKFREQRARSVKIIFENSTINQQTVISGYELELVPPMGVKLKE